MIYSAPDWCHHAGIPRPTNLPADDPIQDLLCRVRGELDSLAAQPFTLDKDDQP